MEQMTGIRTQMCGIGGAERYAVQPHIVSAVFRWYPARRRAGSRYAARLVWLRRNGFDCFGWSAPKGIEPMHRIGSIPFGADDGNRTRVFGLGSGHSAIELHLHLPSYYTPKKVICQVLLHKFCYFLLFRNGYRINPPTGRGAPLGDLLLAFTRWRPSWLRQSAPASLPSGHFPSFQCRICEPFRTRQRIRPSPHSSWFPHPLPSRSAWS